MKFKSIFQVLILGVAHSWANDYVSIDIAPSLKTCSDTETEFSITMEAVAGFDACITLESSIGTLSESYFSTAEDISSRLTIDPEEVKNGLNEITVTATNGDVQLGTALCTLSVYKTIATIFPSSTIKAKIDDTVQFNIRINEAAKSYLKANGEEFLLLEAAEGELSSDTLYIDSSATLYLPVSSEITSSEILFIGTDTLYEATVCRADATPQNWGKIDMVVPDSPHGYYLSNIVVDKDQQPIVNISNIGNPMESRIAYVRDTVDFITNSDLIRGRFNSVFFDKNDKLWTVENFKFQNYNSFSIYSYSDNTWSELETDLIQINDPVLTLSIDSADTKWITATPNGENTKLISFDNNFWRVHNLSGVTKVFSTEVDSDNSIWMATSDGIVKYFEDETVTYNSSNSNLNTAEIRGIKIASDGSKWAWTYNSGIYKFDGTEWVQFTAANSNLPADMINSIVVDGNSVWICTVEGLVLIQGDNMITYTSENSLIPEGNVTGIAVADSEKRYLIIDSQVYIMGQGDLSHAVPTLTQKNRSVNRSFKMDNIIGSNLQFSLEKSSDVQVKLFDLKGRMIQNINMGMMNSGAQSVDLKTSHIGTGVYLLNVTTSAGVFTEMVTLKN